MPALVYLAIVGHTHGGQVVLPLLERPIVPLNFGRRYAIGHIIEGGRHLSVTSGIGTCVVPVRLGVPLEIAC
jgi:predicted MPP superfamily phosphohydrolase